MDLFARTNAPDYVANRTRWLNEAQKAICRLEKWWFTGHECVPISTTAGVTAYTLDAMMAYITGVWRDGSAEMHQFDVGSRPLMGATQRAPTHYRQSGIALNGLIVAPAPNAPTGGPYTITVQGHKFLSDLEGAGDTNTLVELAPYALVFGAMIEAAIHLGRDPAIWKARQDAALMELREQNARRGRAAG